MIDENIQDGDIIIVQSQKTAENGQVVVALIDGNYATVKKFYRETEFIRLEPANPQYKPIFIKTEERIQIQGVVRGSFVSTRREGKNKNKSEVEFLGFALGDCTVNLVPASAKYLRVVHGTALELAIHNQFGADFGGFWLLSPQITQLRRLPEYYSPDEVRWSNSRSRRISPRRSVSLCFSHGWHGLMSIFSERR